MFLDMTLKRNPSLIEYAVTLHRQGEITPDTYVLDIEGIEYNATKLFEAAKKYGINLYMMTKQLGRNPEVAKRIAACGIEKAVAVDPWEAITLGRAGVELGNVGHLVQVPNHMLEEILSYNPEVMTVFTLDKAEVISQIAQKKGRRQGILLKVVGSKDMIYEGQLGGFKEEKLVEAAKKIEQLPGVYIAGVTAFPCFLYSPEKKAVIETENAKTLMRAVAVLKEELGIEIEQINAPSATSTSTLPLLKKLGATHGEPGHAFTGTTPLHGCREEVEIPSMIYVSEVSHIFDDKAYVYGGGYYRRSRMQRALVGKSFEEMKTQQLDIEEIAPESIDYYGTLKLGKTSVQVGDTVIYAFRTQIFVTRSRVALVEGIQKGKPRLIGIYDSLGKKLK